MKLLGCWYISACPASIIRICQDSGIPSARIKESGAGCIGVRYLLGFGK
ncbi:MAG TPA: hypothetical protein VJR94_06775 [Candidatus Nitrosocosmicus sp.]|nr:hypothetical protein [Candidatus Nitrosocosmicus sp.]